MSNINDVILDLNKRHASGNMWASDYIKALDRVKDLALHADPSLLSEGQPKPRNKAIGKTVVIYNQDGLKIERPYKEPFTAEQRYHFRIFRYSLIGFAVLVLGLLQSCGNLF